MSERRIGFCEDCGQQHYYFATCEQIARSSLPEPPASDVPAPSVPHRLHCHACGKSVSSEFVPVPTDTPDRGLVVRAWIECPECIESKAEPRPAPPPRETGWNKTSLAVSSTQRPA